MNNSFLSCELPIVNQLHATMLEKIPSGAAKRFDEDTAQRLRALKYSGMPMEYICAVIQALGYDTASLTDATPPQRHHKNDEWKKHNEMFTTDYLNHATIEEIEDHRAELMDRRSAKRGAARLVASYIYEETSGVFKTNWKVNAMYGWLVREFGFKDSYWTFCKACQQLDGYNRRK